MQIKILEEAEKDIAAGIFFYESQSDGLGKYFLDSILSDIESLHVFAGIHVNIAGYYRLLSKRFPFSIYYKMKDDIVYIYAVLDCRQDPTKTEERFKR